MNALTQLALLSVMALTAVACAPARMAAPADLAANGQELAVSNRSQFSGALVDEGFDVGPYQVSDVDRKWDTSQQTTVAGFTAAESSGGFGFQFHGVMADFAGKCELDANQNDFHLEGGGTLSFQFAQLACSCHSGQTDAELLIDNSGTRAGASVTTTSGHFDLGAVYDLEGGGTSNEPAGYRADGRNAALGAVDVMKPGRMWLANGLSDSVREQTACLFAGLMLYEPPTAH